MATFDTSNLLYVTKKYENEVRAKAKQVFASGDVHTTLTSINNELDRMISEFNTKLGFATDKITNSIEPYIQGVHRQIDNVSVDSRTLVDDGIEETISHPSINAFKSTRHDTKFKTYDFINKTIVLNNSSPNLKFSDGELDADNKVHTFNVNLSNLEYIKVVEFSFTYKQDPNIITLDSEGNPYREPTVELSRVIDGRFFIIRHDPVNFPEQIIVKAIINNADNTGNIIDERIVDVKATIDNNNNVSYKSEFGPQFDLYFRVPSSEELEICIGKIVPYKWLIQKQYINNNEIVESNFKIIQSNITPTISKMMYSKNLNLYFIVDNVNNRYMYTSDPELDPSTFEVIGNDRLGFNEELFVKDVGSYTFIYNKSNTLVASSSFDNAINLNQPVTDAQLLSTGEIMLQIGNNTLTFFDIASESISTNSFAYYTTEDNILSLEFQEIEAGQILIVTTTSHGINYRFKRINLTTNEYITSSDACNVNIVDVIQASGLNTYETKTQILKSSIGLFILANFTGMQGEYSAVLSLSDLEISANVVRFQNEKLLRTYDIVNKNTSNNIDMIDKLIETSLFVFGVTTTGRIKIIDSMHIVDAVRFDEVFEAHVVDGVEYSEVIGFTDENSVLYLPVSENEDKLFLNDDAYLCGVKEIYETSTGIFVCDTNGIYEILPNKSIKTHYYAENTFTGVTVKTKENNSYIFTDHEDIRGIVKQSYNVNTNEKLRYKHLDLYNGIYQNYNSEGTYTEDGGPIIEFKGKLYVSFVDRSSTLYNTDTSKAFFYSENNTFNDVNPYIEHPTVYVIGTESYTRETPITKFVLTTNKYGFVNYHGFSIVNKDLRNISDINDIKNYILIHNEEKSDLTIEDYRNAILATIRHQVETHDQIIETVPEYNTDDSLRFENRIEIIRTGFNKNEVNVYEGFKDFIEFDWAGIPCYYNGTNIEDETIEAKHGFGKCFFARADYKTLFGVDDNRYNLHYIDRSFGTATADKGLVDSKLFKKTSIGLIYGTSKNRLYLLKEDTLTSVNNSVLIFQDKGTITGFEVLNDEFYTILVSTTQGVYYYKCIVNSESSFAPPTSSSVWTILTRPGFESSPNTGGYLDTIKVINNSAYLFSKTTTDNNYSGLYRYDPSNEVNAIEVDVVINNTNTGINLNFTDIIGSDDPGVLYCGMSNKYSDRNLISINIFTKIITPLSNTNANIAPFVRFEETSKGIIALTTNRTYLLNKTPDPDNELITLFDYCISNTVIKEVGDDILVANARVDSISLTDLLPKTREEFLPVFAKLDINNKRLYDIKLPDQTERSIFNIYTTNAGVYLCGLDNEYYFPYDKAIRRLGVNEMEDHIGYFHGTCNIPNEDGSKNHLSIGVHVDDARLAPTNAVHSIGSGTFDSMGCSVFLNNQKLHGHGYNIMEMNSLPNYHSVTDVTESNYSNYYVLDIENTPLSATRELDALQFPEGKELLIFKRYEFDNYIEVNKDILPKPLKGVQYYTKNTSGFYNKVPFINGHSIIEFNPTVTYYEKAHYYQIVKSSADLTNMTGTHVYYTHSPVFKPAEEYNVNQTYFTIGTQTYDPITNVTGLTTRYDVLDRNPTVPTIITSARYFPNIQTKDDVILSGININHDNIRYTSLMVNHNDFNNPSDTLYMNSLTIGKILRKFESSTGEIFAILVTSCFQGDKVFAAKLSSDYKQVISELFHFEIDDLTSLYSGIDGYIFESGWHKMFFETSEGIFFSDVANNRLYIYNETTESLDGYSNNTVNLKITDMIELETGIYGLSTINSFTTVVKWNGDSSPASRDFDTIFTITGEFNPITGFEVFYNSVKDITNVYLMGNGQQYSFYKMSGNSFTPILKQYNSSTNNLYNTTRVKDVIYISTRTSFNTLRFTETCKELEVIKLNSSAFYSTNLSNNNKGIGDPVNTLERGERQFAKYNALFPGLSLKGQQFIIAYHDENDLLYPDRFSCWGTPINPSNIYGPEFQTDITSIDYNIYNSNLIPKHTTVNGFRQLDQIKTLPVKLQDNNLLFSQGIANYNDLNINEELKFKLHTIDGTIIDVNFDSFLVTDYGVFATVDYKICINTDIHNPEGWIQIASGNLNSDYKKMVKTSKGVFYVDRISVLKYNPDTNKFDTIPHAITNGINFFKEFNEGIIIASVNTRMNLTNDYRLFNINIYRDENNDFTELIPSSENPYHYITDITSTSMGLFVCSINRVELSTWHQVVNYETATAIGGGLTTNKIYRAYKTSSGLIAYELTEMELVGMSGRKNLVSLVTQVWEDKDTSTIWATRLSSYITSWENLHAFAAFAYRKTKDSSGKIKYVWHPSFSEYGNEFVNEGAQGQFLSRNEYGSASSIEHTKFNDDATHTTIQTRKFGTWLVKDQHSMNYPISPNYPNIPYLSQENISYKTNDNAWNGTARLYDNRKLEHIKGVGSNRAIKALNGWTWLNDLGWLQNNFMHYVKLVETDTDRLFAFKYGYDDETKKIGYTDLYEYKESGVAGFNYEKVIENETGNIASIWGQARDNTIVQTNTDRVICLYNNKVYLSDDNGFTFIETTSQVKPITPIRIHVLKTGRIVIFDTIVNNGGNSIYLSDNNGDTFTRITTSLNVDWMCTVKGPTGEDRHLLFRFYWTSSSMTYGTGYTDDNFNTIVTISTNNGGIGVTSNNVNQSILHQDSISDRIFLTSGCIQSTTNNVLTGSYYSDNYGLTWNAMWFRLTMNGTKYSFKYNTLVVPSTETNVNVSGNGRSIVMSPIFKTSKGTLLSASHRSSIETLVDDFNGIMRHVPGIDNGWNLVTLQNKYGVTRNNWFTELEDNTIVFISYLDIGSHGFVMFSYDDGVTWSKQYTGKLNHINLTGFVKELTPGILIERSIVNPSLYGFNYPKVSIDNGYTWQSINVYDKTNTLIFNHPANFRFIRTQTILKNGNILMWDSLEGVFLSRNDVPGFFPVANSRITDPYHIIDNTKTHPNETGYSPDYIKDFDIVDYNGVLFVKAFGNDIYKYNNHSMELVTKNISTLSNDVAYVLKAIFDNKEDFNNLPENTENSEIDKFVFKETGVVDAMTGEVKVATQYFLPHNFYNDASGLITSEPINNPKEFVKSDTIKSLYQNVYKGMKANNLINNRFLKPNQNILSDTFKHSTNMILGDVEHYLKRIGNFRIELNVIPSEAKDETVNDIDKTKDFSQNPGKLYYNLLEPFDPFKE